MFSALPPCPEQRETAGKGQGHDSLTNAVPGTREREEEHQELGWERQKDHGQGGLPSLFTLSANG